MGWGDEIIASGQARKLHEQHNKVVAIKDGYGSIRWNEIWEGNPRIMRPRDVISITVRPTALLNAPGFRPYIRQKFSHKWVWVEEWECPQGEIYLNASEKAFGEANAGHVIIEPNLKSRASPNKDWGWQRWEELARLMLTAGIQPVQLGPSGTPLVAGAQLVQTLSFRQACAVLSRASAAVLPEGGLHHAAAALGVKAVVIFGGFISPKQTGYKTQDNLFTGQEPCGKRTKCDHCTKAMNAIDPAMVMARLLLMRGS